MRLETYMYQSADLENTLILHEGVRNFAYLDTTGNITCGVGRNLSKGGQGLSADEILTLLKNDIDRICRRICHYQWFIRSNQVRRDALIELGFNMGVEALLGFKEFLGALAANNPGQAVRALQNSKWIKEVSKDRSDDIIFRIKTGAYRVKPK